MGPSWIYDETIKAITVSELEAHLSKYLRTASRGSQIALVPIDSMVIERARSPELARRALVLGQIQVHRMDKKPGARPQI
jgi:hypothetical protein